VSRRPGCEVAGGGGERGDRPGDSYRDVERDDEGHPRGDQDAEDGGACECVADVAFGFHRLGGEAQHHGPHAVAVHDDCG
jgi:hypothetical protein